MPKDKNLNMKDVIRKFEEDERSASRRRGAFKIDAPFDEALKRILKAKPEPRKTKKKSNK